MGRDVIERISLELLFENENKKPNRSKARLRKILIRSAAVLLLLSLILCLWIVSVSGSGEDGGESGDGMGYYEDDTYSESESENESESESLAESIGDDESGTVETGKGESDTLPQQPSAPVIMELDLSQAEEGDNYVINYTDRVFDVDFLLDRGFVGREQIGRGEPLVLVLHTHTGEEYVSGSSQYKGIAGVVSVGEVLNESLNSRGIGAVHCTVIHGEGRENAYVEARRTIETMQRIYPSIKYVIDLHRLELERDGRPIKTVSANGAAQIRLTVGGNTGDWQEDLSLALALRKKLNGNGARLCMPTVISSVVTNSDLGSYHLVVEVGSSVNTVEEAMRAGELLGIAITEVLVGG